MGLVSSNSSKQSFTVSLISSRASNVKIERFHSAVIAALLCNGFIVLLESTAVNADSPDIPSTTFMTLTVSGRPISS